MSENHGLHCWEIDTKQSENTFQVEVESLVKALIEITWNDINTIVLMWNRDLESFILSNREKLEDIGYDVDLLIHNINIIIVQMASLDFENKEDNLVLSGYKEYPTDINTRDFTLAMIRYLDMYIEWHEEMKIEGKVLGLENRRNKILQKLGSVARKIAWATSVPNNELLI